MDFHREFYGSLVLPGGTDDLVAVCYWDLLPAVVGKDGVHCLGEFGPQMVRCSFNKGERLHFLRVLHGPLGPQNSSPLKL